MSRKDYVEVAKVLRREYDEATVEQRVIIARIAGDLAIVFKQDNPNFDSRRFYMAALGREDL